MALDKKNKDNAYLLGRYVAVVEASNGTSLTVVQMGSIHRTPKALPMYDLNPDKYKELRDEILDLAGGELTLPSTLTADESGRVWIGYFHQKADLSAFYVQCHASGDVIEAVDSMEEAKELIDKFEAGDVENGAFFSNFYEIMYYDDNGHRVIESYTNI